MEQPHTIPTKGTIKVGDIEIPYVVNRYAPPGKVFLINADVLDNFDVDTSKPPNWVAVVNTDTEPAGTFNRWPTTPNDSQTKR